MGIEEFFPHGCLCPKTIVHQVKLQRLWIYMPLPVAGIKWPMLSQAGQGMPIIPTLERGGQRLQSSSYNDISP